MGLKILLSDVRAMRMVPELIIESCDLSLYQCYLQVEGRERLIWESEAKPLRRFNLTELRKLLATVTIERLLLRQSSAYDEMIGQPSRDVPNTLLVELAHPIHDAV